MATERGNIFSISYAATADGTKEVFASAQNVTLSINDAPIDTTNKDTSSWAESISGLRSWSVSFSGLVDWGAVSDGDGHNTFETIDHVIAASNTLLECRFGRLNSTDALAATNPVYEGDGRIYDIEVSTANAGEPPTYSGTITGVGALTKVIA